MQIRVKTFFFEFGEKFFRAFVFDMFQKIDSGWKNFRVPPYKTYLQGENVYKM